MPKVINLPTSTSMNNSDYLIMEASGGGTKKITRANAVNLSNLGGRYIFPNISIPVGTSKTISIGTNASYKSCLILGTVGGTGPVVIAVTINNGALAAQRNLINNTAWSGVGLTITVSGDNLTFTNNASAGGSSITVYAG